jgi:hypothetical protein
LHLLLAGIHVAGPQLHFRTRKQSPGGPEKTIAIGIVAIVDYASLTNALNRA